ncbi:MAG: NfeD family protein [Clostridiales bacterium]|nr:NfeD family protein [Clostridiales bacterium]
MNPAIIWLGLIIILLIIEIATMGLTTIWFAGGALAAFISTFFGASPTTQRTIFLVLSLALLIITRPAALRYMKKGITKTNADSLEGKTAVVTGEINNLAQTGEVMLADVSWTARSKDDACVIPAGSKVRICTIEGVKLIVEEIKEEK